MNEIISLRELDLNDPEYSCKKTALKSKLQSYTPAALLQTREKEKVVVIERTGMMQLDFDQPGV